MNRRIYSKNNIFIAGAICFVLLFSATVGCFLYLSDAFKAEPVVTVHADNIYEETLHAVTDIDYEPFSYVDSDGKYMGMDVELITEIANRLKMNLDLKLMSWTDANELFFSGGADAFLNIEADSVVENNKLIATLPTVEKQYVIYGREKISSVPDLYGRKVLSLHKLPELGLGDGITYMDSYEKIFMALKNKEYEFAICPIQVGSVFLEKMKMTDVMPSYAVGHIYGVIALLSEKQELKERINVVISDMQREGKINELDRKWVSHRYQSMTLRGMIESHPEVLVAFFVILFIIILLFLFLMMQNRNIRDKDAYSKELQEKIEVIDRQNEELILSKEKAESSSRAKSEFLANMSHEIRTPINAVLGMNEMIIRESTDERITTYARNVESAGKNLLSIINDILDFSKIEAGKMEITEANYKLSSILNDVTNMIVFKARQKDLKFNVIVDETLPDELYGDEVRMRQVITNVLNNAVKYTNEGEVTFQVNGKRKNDIIELMFKIIDTGIGIKQEDISKLFGKFERVDLVQNNTIEGTGLGLSITQNLLELMNGDIQVESEYGKGSTFTIHIPQRIISYEPVGKFQEKFEQYIHKMHAYQESFRAPDANILVVDDTEMNLIVIEGLLNKTEVQLDKASSGMKALELTKNKKYDLILMDQRMPQMDGTQTLHNIRKQVKGLNQETPIICLTADAVSGARAKYIEEGFTDYLSKPVESSAVEATLIKYLPASKVILQKINKNIIQDTKQETKTALEEFYESVKGLNYTDAVRFCLNEEILAKTLEQFYRSIKENSDSIEDFLNQKDYKNYTIKVHALKSSARLIGADELSKDAMFLEDCGNNLTEENIENIENKTPKLLNDYRSYLEKLSPLYPDENEKSLPEIEPEQLNEIYEAIQEFASMFDIDSIDNIISMAKKYKIPENQKEKFEAIETSARNMDWNKLEEALKK